IIGSVRSVAPQASVTLAGIGGRRSQSVSSAAGAVSSAAGAVLSAGAGSVASAGVSSPVSGDAPAGGGACGTSTVPPSAQPPRPTVPRSSVWPGLTIRLDGLSTIIGPGESWATSTSGWEAGTPESVNAPPPSVTVRTLVP